MDQLVSIMLIMLFVITAIIAVIIIGNDVMSRAETSSFVQEAESEMKYIRNSIEQVSAEGNGSSRKISLDIKSGFYEANSPKNSIIYYIDGPGIMDYLSRKNDRNLYTISGADATCLEDDYYLHISNSRINATFQKVGSQNSWEPIDTSDSLVSLMQIDTGVLVPVANSSVLIDDVPSSSYGNGYSELLKEDFGQPFCAVHFLINSSYARYDIYYTLFSGADFIVQDVVGSLSGKTITETYTLHINSTDTIRINDTTNLSTETLDSTYMPEKKFVSSEANSTVFGMVFAGSTLFNISLNTSYPGSDYEMKMRQSYDSNRMIVALTNGTWQNIEDHLGEISSDKMVGSQFGSFPVQSHDKIKTAVAAIMNDINLTNTVRWGSGGYDLIISNQGKVNNITNIWLELK